METSGTKPINLVPCSLPPVMHGQQIAISQSYHQCNYCIQTSGTIPINQAIMSVK